MTERLLLDEMFHPSIAQGLATRGHDCRSVASDPQLRQRSDAELVRVAVDESRVLVTNNVIDFERLRRDRIAEGQPVPPLIYTSDAAFLRDRRYIGRLVEALAAACERDAAHTHGGVLWLRPRGVTR